MPKAKGHNVVEERKTKASPAKELTYKQEQFVIHLMSNEENPAEAARLAGYSDSSQRVLEVCARQLMDPRRFPAVAAAIKKARAQRDARAVKTGDDVLAFIHRAMFLNPLDFFEPTVGGGWLIEEEGYKNLPADIACFIEEMELRSVVTEVDGKKIISKKYWVKLVKKSDMVSLAARYQLTQKLQHQVEHQLPWAQLIGINKEQAITNDPVEAKIASISTLKQPPLQVELIDENEDLKRPKLPES